MLTFKINSVYVEFYFGFFFIVALATLSGAKAVGVSLVCCALHEAGHIATMYYYGRRPNAICFYGGGVKIKAPLLELDYKRETIVYASGCVVNLFLFLMSCCVGIGSTTFAQANLLLCVFNLLPFKQLDGGKLTATLSHSSVAWHSAFKLIRFLVMLVLVSAFLKALLIGCISITMIVAIVYIAVSECNV